MKNIFIFLILFQSILFSNFISMNNGARSLALGNAFVALSENADAIFTNPAGLGRNNQLNLTVSHQKLYGISNLYNSMISISLPTPIFRTGLAIQQISLLNIYSEKILYLSAASILRIKDKPIRFGGSVKFESVSVKKYNSADSPSNLDMDLGFLIDFTKNLYFGYSLKYILEPEFIFISDGDKLNKVQTTGVCYKWRDSVYFLSDYVNTDSKSFWNLGSEIWFFNVFSARLGMSNERLTMGFGLKTKKWSIDGAVLSHEQLGSTYRISLGISMDIK